MKIHQIQIKVNIPKFKNITDNQFIDWLCNSKGILQDDEEVEEQCDPPDEIEQYKIRRDREEQ